MLLHGACTWKEGDRDGVTCAGPVAQMAAEVEISSERQPVTVVEARELGTVMRTCTPIRFRILDGCNIVFTIII